MNRPLRWYDTITFSIYFFGLNTLAQTMTPLIVPLLVQRFVGEARQGAAYGTIRLWSLMTALLVQALMGLLSDHSTLPWGRRRPFIVIGTLANLVILALVGLVTGMEGQAGYWTLFGLMLLMMTASNTAHGAVQGILPDLVPENRRGRFSGVKAVLEVPLPVIVVSFTVGKLIKAGNLWAALLVVMIVLLATMLLTLLVPEKRLEKAAPLDLKPFFQLVLMTALFTAVILGLGLALRWGMQLLAGVESATTLYVTLFAAGLAAMLVAVGLGVWLSVRLGIGSAAREHPSFAWWIINRLAFLVGATNLASFTVYYLQGRLGLVREAAAGPGSTLIMIVGVFILATALPSGWLVDRFGRKRLLAASGLVAALGTLAALSVPNLIVIYVGGVLIGAATGLFYTASWALGTDLVPKAEAGRYLGISNLAGAGAGAVGAYIGGPIADFFTARFPQFPGVGYVVLFAIYGLLFLFSVLALWGVKVEKGARR